MRLVILALLVACSEKPPKLASGESCLKNGDCESVVCYSGKCQSKQVGSECDRDKSYHCASGLDCFEGRCRAPGKLGQKCIFKGECESQLQCYKQTCLDDAGIKLADETASADERKQFADKLTQAGVPVPPPVVEKPTVDAAARTGTIRTATATAKQSANVACRSDERLVGGGCKADAVLSSYPSGQSELDTIGARWNCTVGSGREVTAYALCTKLP